MLAFKPFRRRFLAVERSVHHAENSVPPPGDSGATQRRYTEERAPCSV